MLWEFFVAVTAAVFVVVVFVDAEIIILGVFFFVCLSHTCVEIGSAVPRRAGVHTTTSKPQATNPPCLLWSGVVLVILQGSRGYFVEPLRLFSTNAACVCVRACVFVCGFPPAKAPCASDCCVPCAFSQRWPPPL